MPGVPGSPKLEVEGGASEGGPTVLVLSAALALAVLCRGSLTAQTLPQGAGADVIKARCVSCHDTDLITSQRLAAAGWTRELDKMVRWGATLSVEQRDVLQTYLAKNFGPRPSASPVTDGSTAAAGEAVFKRACLGCHGMDLVEQQRLSRAGWVREVEKMMRWGANVSAADKDPLADHLAARFGVR
jgi:mono/diheme cytochrome c family protein